MTRASDTAYSKIREFLQSGAIQPGEQLTEEKLAQVTGVSRTPVREAVRRLESEMLLVRSESKRIFVAQWSRDDVEEMFTLRQMLECHATALAAERLTDAQVDELAAINTALREAIEQNPPDVPQFLSYNRQFHDLISDAAHSPRLQRILALLVEQPVVFRTASSYSAKDLQQSARDHDELISAFRAQDADWAHSVMQSHLRRAFHAFLQAVNLEGENEERQAAE